MSVQILDIKLKEMVASDMYRRDWEEVYTNIDPEQGREKFGRLLETCSEIITNTRSTYGAFMDTGARLKTIRDEELYLYCAEKTAKGYSDFYRFVRDKLGISRTETIGLIKVCEMFCHGSNELPAEFSGYTYSQLLEMTTFEQGTWKKLNAGLSVRKMRMLRKYYKRGHWRVSADTSLEEDLQSALDSALRDRQQKAEQASRIQFVAPGTDNCPTSDSGETDAELEVLRPKYEASEAARRAQKSRHKEQMSVKDMKCPTSDTSEKSYDDVPFRIKQLRGEVLQLCRTHPEFFPECNEILKVARQINVRAKEIRLGVMPVDFGVK